MGVWKIFVEILSGVFGAFLISLPLFGGAGLLFYANERGREKKISRFQFVMLMICCLSLVGLSVDGLQKFFHSFAWSVSSVSEAISLILCGISLALILWDVLTQEAA